MSDYPNAQIRPTVSGVPGLFLVRAGGPVTNGFVGAIDNVIIGIGSPVINNNFEPGDGNVVVNHSNAASLGFGFVQETPTGSGAFVSGPNGSDGSGSAQLTIDATGGEALANDLYGGTRFDHLNFLSYKTYQLPSGRTRRRCSSTPTTTLPTAIRRSRVAPFSSRACRDRRP